MHPLLARMPSSHTPPDQSIHTLDPWVRRASCARIGSLPLSCFRLLCCCPPTSTPAPKSSADLPCWRAPLASHTKTFFFDLSSHPCAHRSNAAGSDMSIPGQCQKLLVLVHVLGADDALDGARGARRQAARCNPAWWINPMPNTRIIIAIQSVPFRLVLASCCTILHCPATLLNPPWPQPPAVSIIILHSFCAPPILPSTPPP